MRIRLGILVFFSIMAVESETLADQKGPIIAVFDIEDNDSGIAKGTLKNLVEYLSARLAKAGYRVIPRAEVRKRLLNAQKASYKECFDQSCQIELGRELAAQKTLAIKILKIATKCQVIAELYDLQQATTDLATTADANCTDEESLLKAFLAVAEDLNRPLLGSQKRLEGGLTELERLSRSNEDTKAIRSGRAWKVADNIARDTMISKEGKIKALRKYLDDFSAATPDLRTKAHNLLVNIDLATLVIMSSPPGAKVFLDGKQSGIAPFTKELKAGEYTVSSRLDGHSDFEEKVKLQPGEKHDLSMMLKKIKPSTLVVEAQPSGAWVDIDGKTAGQVPVAKELTPGKHEVVVKLAGHVIDKRSVTLVANEQKSLNLQLETIPTRPKMLWGHITFWSGVGLTALGAVGLSQALTYQDEYDGGNRDAKSRIQTSTGVMYGGFGVGAALLITGVVMWILAPDEASWAEQSGGYLGASPDGAGLTLGAIGRW